MLFVLRIVSMVLRVGFFLLSSLGFFMLLSGRGERESAHASVMAAIFCLCGSCACDHPQPVIVGLLLLTCVVLMATDIYFIRKAARAGNLFLPVALLCAVGISVSFDAMGAGATSHVLRICIFCAICIAAFQMTRRYVHLIAASFVPLLLVTAALCALPLVPGLGVNVNGATAWIGVAGHRLGQPSELAKVTLALALAGYLGANADRLSTFNLRGIVPLLFVFALAMGTEWMVKDIGTAMVLFAAVAAMVMVSSRKAGVIYALIALVGVSAMLVVAYNNFGYVAQRFDSWLAPDSSTNGGSHLLLASSAIHNGGLIGCGLSRGHAFPIVPEIDTDSIYVIIVEELGLVGGAQVLLAFVALAVSAARIVADLPKESFERNLVNTATVLICAQAFIIVAGITRLIPLTGVTLPFISRGGSSLLSCFLLLGVMLAAGSTEKYSEEGQGVSAVAVPALFSVAFAACLAMTAYHVVGNHDLRLCGLTEHYTLGEVTSSDGVVLAKGTKQGFAVSYDFPEGTFAAHVLGLASDGVTARLRNDSYLVRHTNPVLNVLGLPEVLGQTTLTLDADVQRLAEAQLEGKTGAIVAYNLRTGAILAEASSPTYDPNLSSIDLDDPSISVFNRVIKSSYPPGSTFKIVSSAAALDGGFATADTILQGDTMTLPGGQTVRNLDGYNYGPITLATALEYSSNTAFADLALRMGNEPLKRQAEAFGFNVPPNDTVLNTKMSTYDDALNDEALAWAAVGQPTMSNDQAAGPRVTVIQMAEVMAAVANKGVVVKPYIIDEGMRNKGVFGSSQRAMSVEASEQLWSMLVGSSHVANANVEVAGKTGTAETGSTNVCWYVCAAGDYVVACCIEGTFGLGSTVALPCGLAVLDALAELGPYTITA